MVSSRLAAGCFFLATALGAWSCGDVNYLGEEPPGGIAPGFGGSKPGGQGYGAAYGSSGNQGGGGSAPLECPDELKRCAHLFTLANDGQTSVEIRGDFAPDGWDVGAKMSLQGSQWQVSLEIPYDGAVQYKFVVDGNWILDPANTKTAVDGNNTNSLLDPETCTEFTCSPPLLGDFDWRDAVLYFVFVDRFLDGDASNNGAKIPGVQGPAAYQGGDWAGVTAKIESGYFGTLGVNALWLSVPAQNPDVAGWGNDGKQYSAYHGYWPSDLEATEDRYGSLAELKALVDAAHARDIKVIVDYAMNHVHISAPIYNQHRDWFWPLDNNGANCVCGDGCGWDGADGRRCWFTDYLPDFNFTVKAARDYSVGNAIQWVKDTGIDGFRLDAVKHIEDAWISDLRSRVRSDIESVSGQHFYMVGETFTGDKGAIAYYVDPTTKLDGQFDFPLRHALVSSLLIRNSTMSNLEGFLAGNDGYYGAGIMSTFVGNHDVPRSIHFAEDTPMWSDAWDGGKNRAWSNTPSLPASRSAFERMANGFALIYTLPGVPLIYYGDEVGLPGAGDPDNRRFMQWDGYSASQTFLKQRLALLAEIRAAHPALRRGVRTPLSTSAETIAYQMAAAGDRVVVVINRGDGAASADKIPSGDYQDAIDGSTHSGGSVSVPARSTRILVER